MSVQFGKKSVRKYRAQRRLVLMMVSVAAIIGSASPAWADPRFDLGSIGNLRQGGARPDFGQNGPGQSFKPDFQRPEPTRAQTQIMSNPVVTNAIMNNPVAADIATRVFMNKQSFNAPTPNMQVNVSASVVQAAMSRPINIDISPRVMPTVNPSVSNRVFDAPVSIPVVKFDAPISVGKFDGPANLPINRFSDSPNVAKFLDSPVMTKIMDSPSVSRVLDSAAISNKVFDAPTPKFDVQNFDGGRRGGQGGVINLQAASSGSVPTDGAPNVAPNSGATISDTTSETPSNIDNGKTPAVAVVTFELDEGMLEKQKADTSGRIVLFDSTTLFVPEKDITVETRFGQVHIAKGAVVLVSSSEKELAVYDIHDPKKGSIYIEGSGKKYSLAPGRHVLITEDTSENFAMANAIEAIPHYDVHRVNDNGPTAYTSEFSIPATINLVDSLKALVNSENPEAKKISDKFMKTAAILLHMRGSQYKHYLKPKVTLLSSN